MLEGSLARRRFAALALVAGAASLLSASSVQADCSPPGGVHINEVRYLDGATPEEGRLNPLVELYNKGGSAASIGGWILTDESATPKAVLPPLLSLPAGAFLEVRFETGTDDLDFTDGVGTVYTNGDSVNVFGHAVGAVAFYNSVPTPASIVDFVAWSIDPPGPSGTAVAHALGAGLWTAGDYAPAVADSRFFTLRLVPDGFDHNLSSDWSAFGWSESGYQERVVGSNPIELSPPEGAGFDPGAVAFAWTPIDSAQVYEFQVASDPGFGSLEVSEFMHSTDTTLTLPSGPHYWRVRVSDSCGLIAGGLAQSLSIFPMSLSRYGGPGTDASGTPPITQVFGVLAVPRKLQHKDSRMLCLWDDANNLRPGCTEAAGNAGPWDAPHPDDHAERVFQFTFFGRNVRWTIECPHCRNYCRRATIQMINAFYGGDLTQDRISYQAMPLERAAGNVVAAPEGDLGHDLPMLVASTGPITQWAVDNSTVTGPFVGPSYAQIKAEIQAGYPVQTRRPGHALVVSGFIDANTFFAGFPSQNLVLVRDPWPGPGNRDGWQPIAGLGLAGWWRIRPSGVAALAGHKQEASVSNDTDGDGVVDFDEGYPNYPADRPRRLQSAFNTADTDTDQVADKQDIRSYTFHDTDHVGHNNDALGFPDLDGDGLRAELDCDTDNDGDMDGAEDINGNGASPEAGETDVYGAASRQIRLATNQPVYVPTDPVLLEGETYHANSAYTYYVYNTCPLPLALNQQYTGWIAIGLAFTDAAGQIFPASIGSFPPGCYSVALDVRADQRWGHIVTPPNPPVPCPTCDISTTFFVEQGTPALVGGPFLEAKDGQVDIRWYVADGMPVDGLAIERARSLEGPFEPVAAWNGRTAPGGRSDFLDDSLREPGQYWYRVIVRSGPGSEVVGPTMVDVAAPRLALGAAPNPSTGEATITLTMPRASRARVGLYDSAGRLVRALADGAFAMGRQTVRWDGALSNGARARAGIYFLRAEVDGRATTARVVRM